MDARESLREVLDRCTVLEALELLRVLREGRVVGRCYSGCVVGILSLSRGQDYWESGLSGDHSRSIEEFVLLMRFGETPSNHPRAAQLERWILEWVENHTLQGLPVQEQKVMV